VDPWKTSFHLMIDRWLAKKTLKITTNSTGVKSFYASKGLDPDLFEVIPNGIETVVPDSISREEAFGRLKVEEDRKLILAVGRLWPQKRYRDLIWAAELLATLREDITLVILGDGPLQAELMRFRDSVTSVDRVRFAGNRGDVASLLPHANQFWIGSEYEGQSNSLIEAMQAGLPVVASEIPGNTDLVTDRITGRLYPLGDTAALARCSQWLFENPSDAEQLGGAARERIQSDFTVKAMVERHSELYQRSITE